MNFCPFLKAEIYQTNKIQTASKIAKMAKTAVLEPLNSPKLISRKI